MISCLTVTQPARIELVAWAIGDFAAQTVDDAELVLLHDADARFEAELQALAQRHPAKRIRVYRTASAPLGALRNVSLQLAQGEFVCQWDDDDRHHPQRLALQQAALIREQADACFLSDQLHWFGVQGTLYWDDWEREAYPFNVVPGTLFARRSAMPAYLEFPRGEDSALLHALLRNGARIARLRDCGWAYVYVHHGANAFDLSHHAAISQLKRLDGARLLARESVLRQRLAEYAPPLGALRMPWEGGALQFD